MKLSQFIERLEFIRDNINKSDLYLDKDPEVTSTDLCGKLPVDAVATIDEYKTCRVEIINE